MPDAADCLSSSEQVGEKLAQTGAEAGFGMILEGLKMIKRPSVVCNGGNPYDHKSKINMVDTHRHEYIKHVHLKDGDHVTVSNGKR